MCRRGANLPLKPQTASLESQNRYCRQVQVRRRMCNTLGVAHLGEMSSALSGAQLSFLRVGV